MGRIATNFVEGWLRGVSAATGNSFVLSSIGCEAAKYGVEGLQTDPENMRISAHMRGSHATSEII